MPTYIIPHRDNVYMNRWCDTWGLDIDELGLLYDVKESRVVFPVMHEGKMVDGTGSHCLGIVYLNGNDMEKVACLIPSGCGKVAVVVEDCVSAAVVGYGSFVGVALLGTSLQESHKGYLCTVLNSHNSVRPRCATEDFADGKGTTRTRERCSCPTID